MYKIRLLLVLALPIFNSACSSTSQLTKVDSYVVKACGISRGVSGDSKGKWVGPKESTRKPWNQDTEEISYLMEYRDIWKDKITPATLAAQLDGAFRPLADSIKAMLDTLTLIVQLRQEMKTPSRYETGLSQYRSHNATWSAECDATAARLSE